MESAPPSYNQATAVDVLTIFAPYLNRQDLRSAVRVCSRWNRSLTPHLWGDPTSHLPTSDKQALRAFLRSLHHARVHVRGLTHTVDLSATLSSPLSEPASWLRDLLELLPNLQSLLVRGTPSCDDAALQLFAQSNRPLDSPFPVRLLDISRLPNGSSHSLSGALRRLHNLIYLDLSYTVPAREKRVLEAITQVRGLQVLKLRGCHLDDHDISTLARAIGQRVRSLDIRDNRISDSGARLICEECIAHDPAELPVSYRDRNDILRSLGTKMVDVYEGEDFEDYIHGAFTRSFVNRLAIEDLPHQGITHLYISGNRLSVDGVVGLCSTKRLHVLDVGTVASSRQSGKPRAATAVFSKLDDALKDGAAVSLTVMRIDHGLLLSGHEAKKIYNPQPSQSASESTPLVSDPDLNPPQYRADPASELLGQLPRLTTLILTGIPSRATTPVIADSIIKLIAACAAAAGRAWHKAKDDYSAPPGRRGQAAAVEQVASEMFPLRRLVLEVIPGSLSISDVPTSWHHNASSTTGDRDSEMFAAASRSDFSFFDEPDNWQSSESVSGESTVSDPQQAPDAAAESQCPSEAAPTDAFDTVQLIAAHRKRTKDASADEGEHWKGLVQVVRDSGHRNDEPSDYFGMKYPRRAFIG